MSAFSETYRAKAFTLRVTVSLQVLRPGSQLRGDLVLGFLVLYHLLQRGHRNGERKGNENESLILLVSSFDVKKNSDKTVKARPKYIVRIFVYFVSSRTTG